MILSILLGTEISILNLTKKIPYEMNEYITLTGKSTIQLLDVPIQNIDTIENMPVNVVYYDFPLLSPVSIGLDEGKELYTKIDSEQIALNNSGTVLRWKEGKTISYIDYVNNNLLCGQKIDRNIEHDCSIWISKQASDILNLNVNDEIEFSVDSAAAKKVHVRICGIYDQTLETEYAFFITVPLYLQSFSEVEAINMQVVPEQLEYYNKVIKILDDEGFDSYYDPTFINGMVTLLYSLYGVCILIVAIEFSVTLSIFKNYSDKRNYFFSINRAVGMSNRSVILIMCLIMELLLLVSYVIGLFISRYVTDYIIDYFSKIFDGIKISNNNYAINSVIVLATSVILMLLTSVLITFSACKSTIKELINRKDL